MNLREGLMVRLLFLMRDYLPAFRPDVAVLFGKELPKLGVYSDLLGQRSRLLDNDALCHAWMGGSVYLHGLERGGKFGELLRGLYDMAIFFRVGRNHHIVQVRDKIRSGVLGLIVAKLWRKPFVFWMSFPIAEGFLVRAQQVGRSQGGVVHVLNNIRAYLASKIYYGWIARRADHIFVQSEAMLDFMVAKGVPRNRMTAVPMGVDLELFRTHSTRTSRPERLNGRKVLGYLGALGRSRNSGFLLDVLVLVRARHPEAMLLLAGDGASPDEQRWIRQRIQDSGLSEHVWLTGWLPQSNAVDLISHADIGLSPIPRGELFDVSSPTKAIEYLALGLPCVCNDIPDQQLAIERSGAGICVPMDVEAMAQACILVLDEPDFARELSDRGPAWVSKNRSYEAIAQSVAKVYLRLASN